MTAREWGGVTSLYIGTGGEWGKGSCAITEAVRSDREVRVMVCDQDLYWSAAL